MESSQALLPAPAKRRKSGAGRPVGTGYKPTDQERRLVERMAAVGVPLEDMVLMLPSPSTGRNKEIENISTNTLTKHYAEELKKGRLRANMAVVGSLYRNAVGSESEPGNVTAQIWWTKTRMGWRETVNVAPGESDGRPQGQEGQVYDQDEDKNKLEDARRVAFALALGARLAKGGS